ncbi:MAG TPA: sialidase family protein [Ktedonobacterales bacterium]|nr:sialidase family protein [Ktedonobacterales bacterium]
MRVSLAALSKRQRPLVAMASIVAIALTVLASSGGAARTAPSASSKLPWHDYKSYMAYMDSHYKADFGRDDIGLSATGAIKSKAKSSYAPNFHSGSITQVNQDQNPWPKDEIAVGTDPTNAKNITVMSNDFRQNYNHMYFHTSNNGGETWFDDALSTGTDPLFDNQGNLIYGSTNAAYNFQSDPGVVYDSHGNWYASDITANSVFDLADPYGDLVDNTDSEIDVYVGTGHGQYGPIFPTTIEYMPCNFTFAGTNFYQNCPGQEDKPLIWTDNSPKSPHNGRVYVTWTFFDFVNGGSVIKESFSDNQGLTFSTPVVVSTSVPGFTGVSSQAQFSDLTVDSTGVAHMFWDDFNGCSDNPSSLCLQMLTSTSADGATWSAPSLVSDVIVPGNGLQQHGFRINGDIAPSCATTLGNDHIYCSFGQLNSAGTGTVISMVHSTDAGATWSAPAQVNNDTGLTSDHFFSWTATDSRNGRVWVGWYDTRNDPTAVKVQYFVGVSTDGVHFANQKPVSHLFDPGVSGPGLFYDFFFGDYDQIAVGADGVVHAVWTDTSTGAQQLDTTKVFP